MPHASASLEPASASIETLQRRLLSITEAFACPICHATLRSPILLPCGHILCSECARRHLSIASTCPQPFCKSPATATALTPLRALDTALESIRGGAPRPAPANREEGSRLVFLSRKDARAKARFVERLSANELPTTGSVDALAARDREFVIRWNANIDAAVPRSRKEIADMVMAHERHRERERRKAAHASSAAFFAAKPKIVEDPDVPVEGDDFAALIRKTKARKARLKRERMDDSADAAEIMPAGKVPKLDEAVSGIDIPNQNATSQANVAYWDASVHKNTYAAIYDVDADTLIIPPSPPSVPLSPSETSPIREANREPPPAVQRVDHISIVRPVDTAPVGNRKPNPFHHPVEVAQGKPNAVRPDVASFPTNAVASSNIIEASSPSRVAPSRVIPNTVRPSATQTPSPAKLSTAVSTQPQGDMPGSAEQPGQPSARATPPLSEEQLRRIERNRQIAIERKKLYFQRLRREQMRQPDF